MQRMFWWTLFAGVLFITACESEAPAEQGTAAEVEANTQEEVKEARDAVEGAVLNPNLASREELAALSQLDEQTVQQIINGRPFLGMKDFQEIINRLDEGSMKSLLTVCFVPLNLNTASEEEFLMIPGVGEKMAHEFEEYRPYRKVAQFRREMGKYVDEAEIARYEKYVFVPVALNTATDEEILNIPGVGDRMLHEFKEYRPYKSMEQFRREIGKYVDKEELARLERFVYLEEEVQ